MANVLYLLLGAVLTLAAQACLQSSVVPTVEARKRREDRWERNCVALGELLTGELAEASSNLLTRSMRVVTHRATLKAAPEGEATEAAREALAGAYVDVFEAGHRFEALAESRIEWLAGRIDLFTDDERMYDFRHCAEDYREHAAKAVLPARLGEVTHDEVVTTFEAERRTRIHLLITVEALVDGGPPRITPSWTMRLPRFRRRLSRRARGAKPKPVGQGGS